MAPLDATVPQNSILTIIDVTLYQMGVNQPVCKTNRVLIVTYLKKFDFVLIENQKSVLFY